MATTRLIPLHRAKGRSVLQSLAAKTNYSKNAEKTDDGKYISTYECNPRTVDEEFMLSKREYEQRTGRVQSSDVIAYQIRQAFKPGEVTPEEANAIGHALAMRFTKGKHAFIVCTHTDRAHVHNHIIFNSTTLDGSRKFKNFFLSYLAIQKISDLLCVEHGLSIVENPRPYREREKRTDYPDNTSHRDILRAAIDQALAKKPKDFDAFLTLLAEAGYEIKCGKHTALRGNGQKRFIRLDSLGVGYTEEELKSVLTGVKVHQPRRKEGKIYTTSKQPRLQLLIDIEKKLAEGKGAGYANWATGFNAQQLAEAVCFVKEQGLNSLDELVEQTQGVVSEFDGLSASIKESETRLAEIAALKKHIINYSRTKAVFTEYKNSGYSKSFLESHQEEIRIHRAAKAAFNQYGKSTGQSKIPTIKALNQEYAQVLGDKKNAYGEYRQAKKDMQQLLIARRNIESVLGSGGEKRREEQSL